ncbi:MAG: GatB/YqeY domain-containing protein [Clostridia bacterium]|nr:GatB/YqeY domain-containing protein [Clostridia bacterium]
MIIDEIKKDNVQAMKDKNAVARTIYGVVVNKFMLQNIEKRKTGGEMTDADMVAILQKTIKELTEEAENYAKVGNTAQVEEINAQKAILEKYLPQMMSEDEIRNIIAGLEDKSMPSIMKHFKANFAGKVDMQLVNKIARG